MNEFCFEEAEIFQKRSSERRKKPTRFSFENGLVVGRSRCGQARDRDAASSPGVRGLLRDAPQGVVDSALAAARPGVLRRCGSFVVVVIVELVKRFVFFFKIVIRRPLPALRRPPLLHAPVLAQGQEGEI